MGGSVAWRAARAGVRRIIAYSPVPKDGVAAVKAGAVSEIAMDVERVVEQSELVVLALPPLSTMELLKRMASAIAERPVYCTDVASVKGPVVELAAALGIERRFAGSHPFVEMRHTGFDAASPDTLEGRLVFVTPLHGGEVAAAEVADFWKRVIGAEPVVLDADAHDDKLAWTSQVPQIVASALAVTLSRKGPKGVTYGAGAKTATAPAIGNPDLWTEFILMNKGKVLTALDAVLSETTRLIADIEAGDAKRVRTWLKSGSSWRERLKE